MSLVSSIISVDGFDKSTAVRSRGLSDISRVGRSGHPCFERCLVVVAKGPRPIIESRVLLGSSARPPLRKHHKLGARVLHRPLQPQAARFDVRVSVSDVE